MVGKFCCFLLLLYVFLSNNDKSILNFHNSVIFPRKIYKKTIEKSEINESLNLLRLMDFCNDKNLCNEVTKSKQRRLTSF